MRSELQVESSEGGRWQTKEQPGPGLGASERSVSRLVFKLLTESQAAGPLEGLAGWALLAVWGTVWVLFLMRSPC